MWTLEQLKECKESEDRVEFKKAEMGNMSYDGGSKTKPSDRRKCILGYVVALCNERGGSLVLGMADEYPHKVVGTKQNEGSIGVLESNIYRDLGIRPTIYELFEDFDKKVGRVLVIDIPSRPIGKVYRFEDVPLMRVGEDLQPMSDDIYLKIIQEQEPDFSQQICEGVSIEDLDRAAITILKQKYAKKQNNPTFITLSDKQVLSDLDLLVDNKVTNAALILVGKEDVLQEKLPQAAVMLEYRNSEQQISFDKRIPYRKPFYLMIDELWHDIDLRNGSFPIKEGPYIFDIPFFNEEVIRESVNNAIVHRDYRKASEVIIKQYPQKMIIINAGGFPQGVTIDNLLTIPSTPRNRLLADVLSKTGIVERSGQGIDKIFYKTLSEGKKAPDYTNSDDFHVELSLSAIIEDRAFALFIESIQQNLAEDNKLSVREIVALNQIREGNGNINHEILKQLIARRGLIEKRGRTKGTYYILSQSYYEFTDNAAEYFKKSNWSIDQFSSMVIPYIIKYKKAKMRDFVSLLEGHLTRRQIKVYVQQLVADQALLPIGTGAGTYYIISKEYIDGSEIYNKALQIGLEELEKRGEIW